MIPGSCRLASSHSFFVFLRIVTCCGACAFLVALNYPLSILSESCLLPFHPWMACARFPVSLRFFLSFFLSGLAILCLLSPWLACLLFLGDLVNRMSADTTLIQVRHA